MANEKPKRPVKPEALAGVTSARARPLSKALHASFVRMGGGYGGRVEGGASKADHFDTRSNVEWGVAKGMLTGGPYANTYSLTDRGVLVAKLWGDYQAERLSYKERVEAWKEAKKANGGTDGAD